MSATTATSETPAALAERGCAPSLARLMLVELRKMVDTRAGFWLQVSTAIATVLLVGVIAIVGEAGDQTLARMLSAAVAPASVLLPVIGILLVSSEWSQRTALITFTLVPQRSRVLAAKLAAGVALAFVALAIGLALAAVGTAVAAPGVDGTWSLSLGLVFQVAVLLAASMAIGIGFGALLQASAPAIVLYFMLPFVFALLGSIAVFDDVAEWLDQTRSLAPMTEELLSGTQWARVGTTLLLWMVLPLAAGWWRVARGEVR
jgi:ABC-2 type transport system permease protein